MRQVLHNTGSQIGRGEHGPGMVEVIALVISRELVQATVKYKEAYIYIIPGTIE